MKILIIGGVAGGAAAAARARRLSESSEIIVFERGEYISFANCGLPYFLGNVINNRNELLLETPESFSKVFNVEIRTQNEVLSINKEEKIISVKNLKTGNLYTENYDFLILAPGAEPIKPPIKGIDLPFVHFLKTIPDTDKIKKQLDNSNIKKAVIVGAGYIGIELAENFYNLNIETHIIEMFDQILPPFDKDIAIILERELIKNDIHLHLKEKVTGINDDGIVETSSGKKIQADIVIISAGVIPEVILAKDAGIFLGIKGIVTNRKMQTNDPNIYAVGDVTETINPVTATKQYIPLAGPAAKQAIVAVNNIFGIKDEYLGTIGTAILKVFSLNAGTTGSSEKVLNLNKINYDKVYTFPLNHAGYYPNASMLNIKLIFSKNEGVVLGAQIVGKEGVDKRIDLISVAIKHKLTVKDLSEFELSYAPPFGSAKDAVNITGMAALNHIRNLSNLIHFENLKGNEFLIDVRTVKEFERGSIDNAVNIPLHTLRERLNEIPKDKVIALFCRTGVRSHYAVRILKQNNFKAFNLSGGYLAFKNYNDAYLSE